MQSFLGLLRKVLHEFFHNLLQEKFLEGFLQEESLKKIVLEDPSRILLEAPSGNTTGIISGIFSRIFQGFLWKEYLYKRKNEYIPSGACPEGVSLGIPSEELRNFLRRAFFRD